MFSSSGPFTLRKLTFSSVLTAFATKVFPQPGGPYSSMPERRVVVELVCERVKFTKLPNYIG